MSRYEFSFVVTDVELSEDEKTRVSRAVALAGATVLASSLPAGAVTAPVVHEHYFRKIWCGIPAFIEFPGEVRESQDPGALAGR